jgi:Bacterial Ig-like domain (group 3)
MTRLRRRLLAALLGTLVIGASLATTATPATAAVPLSDFTISSNHATSVFGQSVTLFAQLTGDVVSPTGTVDFLDGATPLCSSRPLSGSAPSSTASCTTTAFSVGSHGITAEYSGDATYDPQTTLPFSQTVGQAATSTAIASPTNPSVATQSVTVTATVAATAPGGGTATGSVTFQDDGVDVTGCGGQTLAGGTATCTTSTLAVGSHPLTALYAGSSSYFASTSSIVVQNVGQGSSSLALTSNHQPASAGQSVRLTASATATAPGGGTSTGMVAFFVLKDDHTRRWLATVPLTNGIATTDESLLPVGRNTVSAVYRGSNSSTGSEATLQQTIRRSGTSTTVVSTRSPAIARRFIAFHATVTPTAPGAGTPHGTVAFFRTRGESTRVFIGSHELANGRAKIRTDKIPAGTHTIVAVYRGDPTFTTSTDTVTQRITPS